LSASALPASAESGLARALQSRAAARAAKGALGLALFFGAWQASVAVVDLPPTFYPAPATVWLAFVELMRKGILLSYIADSLGRYAMGLMAGTAIGIAVGLALALVPFLGRMFQPFVNFLYAMVEAAWVPLLVLWFGLSLTMIILTIALVVVWPVLYGTMTGVRAMPRVFVNAALSLGASRWQVLKDVILPGALPYILTGFRVSAGFGFRALILGELIGAKSGVGFLIFNSATALRIDKSMVGMAVMGLLWLLIDSFYLKPLEDVTVRRWGLMVEAGRNE
jgi:NitT/TauT family transport system permease protein/taurine transport system permease protein